MYVGGDRGYYGDRYDGPRVRFYGHDRGWHRGWEHREMNRDRYYDGDVVVRHRW